MGQITRRAILGDPGGDSGDEGKSKRAEKCGAKKSKERREEPLGTMSYQTSSKRSPPFWLLIGARKLVFFALLAFLYFSSCLIFRAFRLSLAPTIYLPLGLRGWGYLCCVSCFRNSIESKTALSRDTCHFERAGISQWFVSVSSQK